MGLNKYHRAAKAVIDATKNIKVGNQWTDDHVLCADIFFDRKKVPFWYCGWETLASATYANESESARKDLRGVLASELECQADTAADYASMGEAPPKDCVAVLELFGLTPEEAIEKYAPTGRY